VTIFLDDLDGQLASSAARGLEPEQLETYDNGVRKATFGDQTAIRSASEERLWRPSCRSHRGCAESGVSIEICGSAQAPRLGG
jgi:hypothetical protein